MKLYFIYCLQREFESLGTGQHTPDDTSLCHSLVLSEPQQLIAALQNVKYCLQKYAITIEDDFDRNVVTAKPINLVRRNRRCHEVTPAGH